MSYTPKTEAQIAWDVLKAGVNAKIAMEVAAYRIARRDELLSDLWPAFSAALQGEEMLELDPEMEKWINDAVRIVDEARLLTQ